MRIFILFVTALLFLVISACDYWQWELEAVRPPHPQVTEIMPAVARFDSIISLKGAFFCPGDTQLHEVVFPSGLTVKPISVPSADCMLVKVPKAAGCGPIVVQYLGYEEQDYNQNQNSPNSNSPNFTYELTPVSVENFAGKLGNNGCEDCLDQPAGLAVDLMGNVWVADKGNHIIRKISSSGVIMKTLGGKGLEGCQDDPDGQRARFRSPTDVTIDDQGILYVTDSRNFTIRRIVPTGSHAVCTIAGKCGVSGLVDKVPGDTARFEGPIRITSDGSNYLYVADQKNGRSRISRIEIENVCSVLSGWWTSDFVRYGYNESGYLSTVWGAGYLPAGGVGIEKVLATDGAQSAVFSYIAASGAANVIKETGLNDPRDIEVDDKRNIYIADTDNHKIVVLQENGAIRELAGSGIIGHANGAPSTATFNSPEGLALDRQKNILYVSDTKNYLIRKIVLE